MVCDSGDTGSGVLNGHEGTTMMMMTADENNADSPAQV